MKDILKVMWLDFCTSSQSGMPAFGLFAVMLLLLGLFISPMCPGFCVVSALIFIVPLQGICDKSGFHKLYGILPVSRKSITRGRFAFISAVMLVSELTAAAEIFLARHLLLYRFLPNQNGNTMQLIAETFKPEQFLPYGVSVGFFVVFCVFFSYMQMMGQIFGQENEMKIIMLTIGVITVIGVTFAVLSEHDVIPAVNLEHLTPSTWSGKIAVSIVWNLGALLLCGLFGEITAAKISKREL